MIRVALPALPPPDYSEEDTARAAVARARLEGRTGEARAEREEELRAEDEALARERRVSRAPAARFTAASSWASPDVDSLGGERYATWCPGCQGDHWTTNAHGQKVRNTLSEDIGLTASYALAFEHCDEPDTMFVFCGHGCEPEVIAAGVARRVREAAYAHAGADERNLAAALSLGRVLEMPPGPPDLLDGLLSSTGLTMLVGDAGDGKTFVSLLWAVAVAAGVPVLGRVVRRGRVLLVLLEGDPHDWRRRIEQLARGLGVDPAALVGQLDVYDEAICTLDGDSTSRLARAAELRGYVLVVVDNLTEARGTSSENDNTAMAAAVRPLREMARDRAVLLLHHVNASGDTRGATAIDQACDEVLKITKAGSNLDSPITIARGKTKRGGGKLDLRYRLVDIDDRGERVAPSDPAIVERRRAVLAELVVRGETREREPAATPVVSRADERRVRALAALTSGPMSAEALTVAIGGRREKAIRLRGTLEAEGVIEKNADGLWQTRTPAPADASNAT